jgi:hypothetical protein
MTLARPQLEMLMFTVARMRELLALVGELLAQVSGYLEHLRHGGDPNEGRRDRWVTRDDMAKKYRGVRK